MSPKNIFIPIFLILLIYIAVSCNKDDNLVKNEPVDLGILRTNEFGQILGGDTTDWCIHKYIDTFTTAYIINVFTISNTINKIWWKTYKQYHCYGFDVERSINTDSNYVRCGFVAGSGTIYDTIDYIYYDTLSSNASNYKYRLKVMDIYGNFKYAYITYIIHYPLNYSFGPAFPNPVYTNFKLPFDIPKDDTVSIYILNGFDTIFFIRNERKFGGSYMIDIYNNYNFHNVQKRLYIKCSSLPVSDSCRNYGDIEFE